MLLYIAAINPTSQSGITRFPPLWPEIALQGYLFHKSTEAIKKRNIIKHNIIEHCKIPTQVPMLAPDPSPPSQPQPHPHPRSHPNTPTPDPDPAPTLDQPPAAVWAGLLENGCGKCLACLLWGLLLNILFYKCHQRPMEAVEKEIYA